MIMQCWCRLFEAITAKLITCQPYEIVFMTSNSDFFSKLVNWFTKAGQDKQPILRAEHERDAFSKLINKISG